MKKNWLIVIFSIFLLSSCGNVTSEVESSQISENYFEDLKNELHDFSTLVETSNYYSFEWDRESSYQNIEFLKQKTKHIKNPFYYEGIDEYGFDSVISLNDNKVVKYTNQHDNYYTRKILGTLDSYKNFDIDRKKEALEMPVNEENNVIYQNNKYKVSCPYKDLKNEYLKSNISNMVWAVGLTTSSLDVSQIVNEYVFQTKSLSITTTITITEENKVESSTFKILHKYDLNEFEPKNMNSGEYIFQNAYSFDDVLDTYSFDKPINLNRNEKVYFKINTEKGMISTSSKNISIGINEQYLFKMSNIFDLFKYSASSSLICIITEVP